MLPTTKIPAGNIIFLAVEYRIWNNTELQNVLIPASTVSMRTKIYSLEERNLCLNKYLEVCALLTVNNIRRQIEQFNHCKNWLDSLNSICALGYIFKSLCKFRLSNMPEVNLTKVQEKIPFLFFVLCNFEIIK